MLKLRDTSLIIYSDVSEILGLYEQEMMQFDALDKINWILHSHEITNHKYADYLPYSFHLNRVANNFMRFYSEKGKDFISAIDARDLLIACFGHDLIEDARISYGDIKTRLGERIADLIYACTELRGKTYIERKGPDFWKVLNQTPLSNIVKLCDIQANLDYTLWDKDIDKLKKQKKVYDIIQHNLVMDEFSLYIYNNIGKFLN